MSFGKICTLLLLAASLSSASAYAQDGADPFKLNAQTNEFVPGQPYVPSYGAPKMIGVPKKATPPPPVKKTPPPKPIKAGINTNTNIQKPVQQPRPMPMATQQPVQGVLPAQFLGTWKVLGNRTRVEGSNAKYQQGFEQAAAMTTSNVWTIQGSPEQGYMMSTDQGVSTPILVESQGDKAVFRYQHPIQNCMAQEAVVMQLLPGGGGFEGLERTTIVKQGEQPRAKITYQLMGHRQ